MSNWWSASVVLAIFLAIWTGRLWLIALATAYGGVVMFLFLLAAARASGVCA